MMVRQGAAPGNGDGERPLRAVLDEYLEARAAFYAADREVPKEAPHEDWEAACSGLRAAVLRRFGINPHYATPRPVAIDVGGRLVVVAPDPNASIYPELGGRTFADSWLDGDHTTVIEAADVLAEDAPPVAPADLKPIRRKAGLGGRA
jgi:hypothetical protein